MRSFVFFDIKYEYNITLSQLYNIYGMSSMKICIHNKPKILFIMSLLCTHGRSTGQAFHRFSHMLIDIRL